MDESTTSTGLTRATGPINGEFKGIVSDLIREVGSQAKLADLLALNPRTISRWRAGWPAGRVCKRVTWFAWAALLHPEKLKTRRSIETWGREE